MHNMGILLCCVLNSESENHSVLSNSSMGVSRPEYRSGLPYPSPGDLPNPEINPRSPALQADSLPAEPSGKSKEKSQTSIEAKKNVGKYG